MEMTIPITLIVKAPNQQIEDQTVKCELSWTISRLKGHLSEVYPSKPASHEQKLIYSGQLLPDTVVLKDVLRNYDGQDTHTVHLVCAPSKTRIETPKKPEPKIMNDSPSVSATQENVNVATSTTGLRHRTIIEPNLNDPISASASDYRTMWNSASQMYTNPNQYFTDPNQYAIHAALMQQAYAQYLNQYMQMISNQRLVEQQRDPEPAPQAEPANADGAQEEHEGEEAQADRDWLDWFYVVSRIMVLFCIVYFYSSPLRFALVLILGIGLYLYQTGFFRPPALINNNNINNAPRPENNNVQQPNVEPAPSNQSINQNQPVVDQRPTMLNIMWTFFTTFFASLIPEIPNA